MLGRNFLLKLADIRWREPRHLRVAYALLALVPVGHWIRRNLRGTDCFRGSRQTQLLEITAQESELVVENPSKLGICRSKEDLSRSAYCKLAKMIEERRWYESPTIKS